MIKVENGIEVNNSVYVRPRLNVLYMVISELADQFGANETALETIRKGVLEKQYIKKITLRYYNEQDEVVGEVYFAIDWNRYEINASNADGANITLTSNRSVYSQISEMSEVIVKYVNRLREDLKIKKICTWYRTNSTNELKEYGYNVTQEEIDKELGLSKESTPDKFNLSRKFEHNLEFIFGVLDELKVGISRN